MKLFFLTKLPGWIVTKPSLNSAIPGDPHAVLNAPLLSARPEVAAARKAQATSEGPSSRLAIRMLPGLMLGLEFTMWPCPEIGLRCRFAALALTRPNSMS